MTVIQPAPAFAEGVVVISDIGPIKIEGVADAVNDNGAGVTAIITNKNGGAVDAITLDFLGGSKISGTTEGIRAENLGTGGINIDIRSGATVTGENAIRVKTNGGTATVNNSGTLNGGIQSEGTGTTLRMTNSGTWNYGDNRTSTLEGNDLIVNNGTFNSSGTATFDGLEQFTNTNNGRINLAHDGDSADDTVHVTGNATLNGDLIVNVDLRSGQGHADLFKVDGATNGNVNLVFANFGQEDKGGLFANRILLVDGGSGDINFTNDANELGSSGFINYIIRADKGDIFIESELDETGAGGVVTSIASTLNAVATIFHKPSSAFTTGCNDPGPDQVGFGTWARSNGGSIDTQLDGRSSIGGTSLSTKNRTNFYGLQAGLDTAFCNIRGKELTIHAGLTGGYIEGDSSQRNGGFSTDFDSYFVGIYGALSKGAFSAEAELRYDDHSLKLSHSTPGVFTQPTDTDGETYSGMLTGSYEISLSEASKLVPSLGVSISSTGLDSFAASGGVVRFDDLFSVMGYAGLTATTTIPVKENLFVLPFASATLYNEFAGEGDSSFSTSPTDVADISTDRIGTFGQVGLGINAVRIGNLAMKEPNIFGSLRVDAQIGDSLQGWGVTGAVRLQF